MESHVHEIYLQETLPHGYLVLLYNKVLYVQSHSNAKSTDESKLNIKERVPYLLTEVLLPQMYFCDFSIGKYDILAFGIYIDD